jgi:hypothetical protein
MDESQALRRVPIALLLYRVKAVAEPPARMPLNVPCDDKIAARRVLGGFPAVASGAKRLQVKLSGRFWNSSDAGTRAAPADALAFTREQPCHNSDSSSSKSFGLSS